MKFFGWYEDTENIYFAMEFIGFGNLAELIGSNGMAEDDAKIITTQLLKGLEVMHENKFCHRDLKPEVRILLRLGLILKWGLKGITEYPHRLKIAHHCQNQRLWYFEAISG